MIFAMIACAYMLGAMPTELSKPACVAVYDVENVYANEESCKMRFEEIMQSQVAELMAELAGKGPTKSYNYDCYADNVDTTKIYGLLKSKYWPIKVDS